MYNWCWEEGDLIEWECVWILCTNVFTEWKATDHHHVNHSTIFLRIFSIPRFSGNSNKTYGRIWSRANSISVSEQWSKSFQKNRSMRILLHAFQQFGAYANTFKAFSVHVDYSDGFKKEWMDKEDYRESTNRTKNQLQFNWTHGRSLVLLNSMNVEKPLQPIPNPYYCLSLYAKRFVFN